MRLSRDEKKARTRERLLDAAEVVFARDGYAGATLDEVAAAAGLTKGAVYSNFDSKEDMFFALIDRGLEGDLSILMDESRPLIDRVIDFALQGARLARSRRGRAYTSLELEFALLSMRDERARKLVRDIHRRTRQRLGVFLEQQAARECIMLPLAGESLATLLLATLRGLLQQHLQDPSAVTDELVEHAVRACFVSR